MGRYRHLELSGCLIDLERGRVARFDVEDGRELELSELEQEVLEFLIEHRGSAVSTTEIRARLWADVAEPSARTLSFALHSLSTKIEARGRSPRHLRRLPGGHYLFELGQEEEPTERMDAPGLGSSVSRLSLELSLTLGSNIRPAKTSFVGRESELADLWEMLSRPGRLVTLVGPAGCGKSRLAQHFCLQEVGMLERWSGGVWRVDLAACRGGSQLTDALAGTLGIKGRSLDDPEETAKWLAEILVDRGRSLLLLDSLDRIGADGRDLLDAILSRTPDLLVIATSRQRLNLNRETVFRLDPLPPQDAVALLTERAISTPVEGVASTSRSETLAQLAQRLDGLPLALELAAAQLSSMSALQLLKRLEAGLGLPEAGRKSNREPHSSLRAAIEGSWEVLDEEERLLLAQVSVFRGGFSLPAAAAVAETTTRPVTQLLASLCDRSVLYTQEGEALSGLRFHQYSPLREFGRHKLKESGHYAATLARHRRWFIGWGEQQVRALETIAGFEALAELRLEQDNLLAVFRRTEGTRPAVAARAALILELPLHRAGQVNLWQEVLDASVDLSERSGDDKLLVRSLTKRASRRRLQGEVEESDGDLALGLQLAQGLGDAALELQVRIVRAALFRRRDQYDACAAELKAGYELAETLEDQGSRGRLLTIQGLLHADRGEFNQATQLHRLALGSTLALGNVLRETQCRSNLGARYMDSGRLDEAAEQFELALKSWELDGSSQIRLRLLSHLGALRILTDEREEATAILTEAIALARGCGEAAALGWNVLNLGAIHTEQGDFSEAEKTLRSAIAIFKKLSSTRGEALALGNLGAIRLLSGDRAGALEPLSEGVRIARRAGSRHVEFQLLGYLSLADSGAGASHLEGSRELLSPDHPTRDKLFLDLCSAILAARSGDDDGARTMLRIADQTSPGDLGPDARILRILLRDELQDFATTI